MSTLDDSSVLVVTSYNVKKRGLDVIKTARDEVRNIFAQDPEYLEMVNRIVDKILIDSSRSRFGDTRLGKIFDIDLARATSARVAHPFLYSFGSKGGGTIEFVRSWERLSREVSKGWHRSSDLARYVNGVALLPGYLRSVRDRVMKLGAKQFMSSKEDLEAAAEAPARSPLDRIAFADQREGVPFEPNNELENALYAAFNRYVAKNKPIPEDMADVVRKILKKGHYDKVFSPPTVSTIYRGAKIKATGLRKILGLGPKDKIPTKGSVERRFKITPKAGGATSWSTSKKVSRDFAVGFSGTSKGGESAYSVIFFADTGENKNLVDMKKIYKVGEIGLNLESEKEVLAFDPVRAFKIAWSQDPYDL